MMNKKLTLCQLTPALFVAVMLVVALSCSGCAIKNIIDMSPSDQAASSADKMMDTYTDVYDTYNQMKSSIPAEYAETKQDFIDAMNLAKPAIGLAVQAATDWKRAVDQADVYASNSTANASLAAYAAEREYNSRLSSAQSYFNKALALWAQIKGEK